MLDRADRRVRGKPELRTVMPRLDRLVRVGLDAERHTHEHANYSLPSSTLRLVLRVECDGRARLGRRVQLLVGLRVPVDDDALTGDPRRARERQLSDGGDVRADSLLGEEPHDRDVRERLRSVHGKGVRYRCPHLSRGRSQRLFAVEDERRPEPFGERRARRAADRQLAPLEAGGKREELEHLPILPVTLFGS